MTDTATTSSQFCDPSLARIIARVESSGNISAVRFEPTVYDGLSLNDREQSLIEKIAALNICSHDTARVIFSSSYGLYQIMGFNVYQLGFDVPILAFWQSDEVQLRCLQKFLNNHQINLPWSTLKDDPAKLGDFAARYNGPNGRVTYANAMRRAAMELGL
jgi:hypothetical protein